MHDAVAVFQNVTPKVYIVKCDIFTIVPWYGKQKESVRREE